MEHSDLRYDQSFVWACRLKGSVLPKALAIAIPAALISALVHHNSDDPTDLERYTNLVGNTGPWSGFSFLVGFIIVFRTSQSYGRYWNALNTSHKMMDDWFESASSFCAFTRGSAQPEEEVEKAMHTAVRLYSILSASALQELSDVGLHHTWGLETLDANGIDDASIHTLDESQCRVELVYQWLQQIVMDSMLTKVIHAPPPIVGRTLAELASGMSNFHDAMKHAKIPFPLPYAQTTMWLLIVHWVLTPLVMAHWTSHWYSAALFTLVQVWTVWSLNEIGQDFEKPFGGGALDIDPTQLQTRFNKQLVLLVEPKTRRTPMLMPHVYPDTDALKRVDNIHKAALQSEGWELQDVDGETIPTLSVPSMTPSRVCCCFRRNELIRKVGVNKSRRFCGKRYGIIDGEQTAVLTVGIYTDHLVLAVPREAKGGAACKVPNRAGEECELRWKKVPINERHGLRKEKYLSWGDGDFLDFPKNYRFYQEDLVTAFHARQVASQATVDVGAEAERNNARRGSLTAGIAAQLGEQSDTSQQPSPQTLPSTRLLRPTASFTSAVPMLDGAASAGVLTAASVQDLEADPTLPGEVPDLVRPTTAASQGVSGITNLGGESQAALSGRSNTNVEGPWEELPSLPTAASLAEVGATNSELTPPGTASGQPGEMPRVTSEELGENEIQPWGAKVIATKTEPAASEMMTVVVEEERVIEQEEVVEEPAAAQDGGDQQETGKVD